MPSEAKAVESLVELGLTEYEARSFVALTRLSEGSAKEISKVADIPQSRVYDVAERLYEQGLVDIQESDPRKYYALPVPIAVKRIRQEYSGHLDAASENLRALESRSTEGNGVWETANRVDVVNRTTMQVENAEEEVYLHVADEELLETELLDELAESNARGVSVLIEVPSESARERVYNAVPAARVALSDLELEPFTDEHHGPGRLLMVDRATVLMSAVEEGLVPGETDETGLWGKEVGNGLVAWLRRLLESRMQRLNFETQEE